MGDTRRLRAGDRGGRGMLEALERRALLSAAPAGPAFPITGDATSYWDMSADAQGNFVAVWERYDGTAGRFEVEAGRFDAAGNALGATFQVSAVGSGRTPVPEVAVNASGSFVVTWDGSDLISRKWVDTVHARRFNAAGQPLGDDFLVKQSGEPVRPTAAVDDAGDFLVAWSGDKSGSGAAVYAQRYTATGAKAGKEFQVNNAGSGAAYPSAAMDAGGDFAIAWQDSDGSGSGIYARRFAASGSALGGQFRVNTASAGDQTFARVAMDAAGDFIVGWGGTGAYARRYDASGAATGGELLLGGGGGGVSVSMDRGGNAVVGWSQANPDATTSIYAQQIDAAGNPLAGTLLVTTDTNIGSVRVSAQPDLGFVVGWGRTGFETGIFGERYIQPVT
jgi:hypothetical protein